MISKSASTTLRPEGSVTVPVIVARSVCASSGRADRRNNTNSFFITILLSSGFESVLLVQGFLARDLALDGIADSHADLESFFFVVGLGVGNLHHHEAAVEIAPLR